MSITVEAVYSNGILKLMQPLPLKDQAKVRVTIEQETSRVNSSAGIIPCTDPQLIEWAATDSDLAFPPPPEER